MLKLILNAIYRGAKSKLVLALVVVLSLCIAQTSFATDSKSKRNAKNSTQHTKRTLTIQKKQSSNSLYQNPKTRQQDIPSLHANDDKAMFLTFKYALQKDYFRALEFAHQAKDPVFAQAAITAIKIHQNPTALPISSIDEFLRANPWLPKDIYEKKVEKILNKDYAPSDINNWFRHRDPYTEKGKLFFIYSQIKLGKLDRNNDEVRTTLRKIWQSNEFDLETEEFMISEFKDILTLQDCLEKIDYLSWNKSFQLAHKLISVLPSEFQHTPQKRLASLKSASEGKSHTTSNDSQLNDIMLYFTISQLIKEDNYDKAVPLLLKIKTTAHPERWWKLRNLTIRDVLNNGEYKTAYSLSKHHGLSSGSDYAEAEFLAGWLALRFLQDPKKASIHFNNLYENTKLGNSKSKAAYWLARAFHGLKDKENEAIWLKQASTYTSTFYGQLALASTKKAAKFNYFDNKTTHTKPNNTQDKAAVQRATMFSYYLFKNDQKFFAYSIINSIPNLNLSKGELENAANFFNKRSLYPLSVELGRASANKSYIPIKESYPRHLKIEGNRLTKALYYSIIRQESNFDQSAMSSAGARGLMQLMPATAEKLASTLGLPKDSYSYDPRSNVLKGVTYIDQLHNQFDSYILAIASYNAGPGNVRKWVNKFGDPRDLKTIDEKLDWIEMIPFIETRNYVKKVIENMVIYDYLLSPNNNAISIHKFID